MDWKEKARQLCFEIILTGEQLLSTIAIISIFQRLCGVGSSSSQSRVMEHESQLRFVALASDSSLQAQCALWTEFVTFYSSLSAGNAASKGSSPTLRSVCHVIFTDHRLFFLQRAIAALLKMEGLCQMQESDGAPSVEPDRQLQHRKGWGHFHTCLYLPFQ